MRTVQTKKRRRRPIKRKMVIRIMVMDMETEMMTRTIHINIRMVMLKVVNRMRFHPFPLMNFSKKANGRRLSQTR